MLLTLFLLKHSHCRLLRAAKLSGIVSSVHCCMTSLVRAVRAARHDVVPELMLLLATCRHWRVVADERKAGTDE